MAEVTTTARGTVREGTRPEASDHAGCDGLSRRCVLRTGAVVAGVTVLAACGGGSGSGGGGGSTGAATGGAGTATGLVALADVPVGSAVVARDDDGEVVVAQPTEGTVVAFSAVCTHQGCSVQVTADQLVCPCHNSVFDIATGENLEGPAREPLPEVAVEVVDGAVVRA